MSEEQLKSFLEKAKGDSSLQEKLKGVTDADSVIAIAKDAGFMFTVDDFNKAQSELSEDELEGVAGGVNFWCVLDGTTKVHFQAGPGL